MMRKLTWLPILLSVGCTTIHSLGRTAEVVVYPKITVHTQSVVAPYNLSSIATLDIIPCIEVTPGSFSPISSITGSAVDPSSPDVLKLTQASPSIDPYRPFILKKLKPNQKYRILGKAYKSDNGQISADTTSYVDVVLTNNDAPTMAQLPIQLIDTQFGANAVVSLQTTGRFDYLKSTLFLVTGGTQVAVSQTTNPNANLNFGNLQAYTNYRVVVEAYKLGGVKASNSVDLNVTNDNSITASLSLNVPYIVSTFVGNTTAGFINGQGTAASFNTPQALVFDRYGNLYVSDSGNRAIRKVTPNGTVTTVAGNGVQGFTNAVGTSATFKDPVGIAMDSSGNLYVVDRYNYCIRKITPAGSVSTFIGTGTSGYADGTGLAAYIKDPYAITIDPSDILYLSDTGNSRIRKITPTGIVTTLAGNGSEALVDGTGTNASFYLPGGITIDPAGNLFVAGNPDNRIRKVTSTGLVTSLAGSTMGYADGTGTNAAFNIPKDIACDAQGNLYVADYDNQCLRKVTPEGVVTTILGNRTAGYLNGTGLSTQVSGPRGLAFDPYGNLYLADTGNNCIRKIQ